MNQVEYDMSVDLAFAGITLAGMIGFKEKLGEEVTQVEKDLAEELLGNFNKIKEELERRFPDV